MVLTSLVFSESFVRPDSVFVVEEDERKDRTRSVTG